MYIYTLLIRALATAFLCCGTMYTIAQPVNPGANIPTSTVSYPAISAYPDLQNFSAPAEQNYIRKVVPDIATASLTIPTNIMHRQTTYFMDGMGRPLQTVGKQAHADGYDLIEHHVYDNMGRESYQYLPYAYPTTAGSHGGLHGAARSDVQNFFSGTPGEEPYTKTEFEPSPLGRVTRVLMPGHNWVGSNRGKYFRYETNDAWIVSIGTTFYTIKGGYPRWTIANTPGALPQCQGDYQEGELYITGITDEDGKYAEEIKDKLGRTVIKRSKIVDGIAQGPMDYAYTSYVYDDLNRLRCVITPEAHFAGGTVSGNIIDYQWSLAQAQLNGLCYQYFYDELGRMVERKLPGKAVEYFVYDKRDRLVVYQDGNLRKQNKWMFHFYDASNRPTVIGWINYSTVGRQAMMGYINNTINYPSTSWLYYIKNYDLMHVYPPDNLAGCTLYTFTYYDNYDWMPGNIYDNSYFLINLPSTVVHTGLSPRTNGLVTGSRLRVLDGGGSYPNTWLRTTNYYDEKGRIIQTHSQNLRGGMDITSNLYYFQGDLYKSILRHQNPTTKSIPGATDVLTQYFVQQTYSRNFSTSGGNSLPWRVTQKINDGNIYDLAYYEYDHKHRLTNKQLTIGNVSYHYNLVGWLTRIRAAEPDSNWMNSQVFFYENLFYDQGFGSRLYNGNIAGITWRGYHTWQQSLEGDGAYGYTYDGLNRLKHAEYRRKELNPSGQSWEKHTRDYTVSGITYDKNGNIQALNRRGVTPSPIDMDILSYTYYPSSNQLQRVEDAVSSSTTFNLPDFKNGATLDQEYTYDSSGNMIADANKKITSIAYNHLNKPITIAVQGQGSIEYIYDALGNRLQKRLTDSNNHETVYDYIGNFVYKDSVLQYILNDEGRARPVANPQDLTKFVYDYFIKDHLGNVRSTVTANPIDQTYLASHEIAMANTEQLFFDNIPTVREDKPGGEPGDESAAELIAEDPEKRVGTAIMLRVMPGDQFTIRADAYFDQEGEEQGTLEPNELVESLLTTLMGGHTYDGIPLEELPENLQIIEQTIGHPETANTLENIISANYNPDYPKAHLNILFFDGETMELNEEYSKVLQVTGDNIVSWGTIEPYETEIPIEPGYLVVFVDNQSIGRPVWFDNINIEHYNSQVLDQNHYYPFGLTHLSSAVSFVEQPYKYNTKELERSFGLEMYDYGARQHDPQLGRFWQMDRFSEKYYSLSPYSYGANNPAINIDVNGDSIFVTALIDNESRKTLTMHYGQIDGKWGLINNGKIYNGGGAKKITEALNDIRTGGEFGASYIGDLVKGEYNVTIFEHSGRNTTQGSDIYADPDYPQLAPTESGTKAIPFRITLGHELDHASNHAKGITFGNWTSVSGPEGKRAISQSEISATHIENRIRAEQGLPLRTHYARYIGDGSPIQDTRILDNKGRSLYYRSDNSSSLPKLVPKKERFIYNSKNE